MAQKCTHSGTKWQNFAKSNAFFCLFLQKMCVFVQNRTDGDAKHRANARIDHFADVGKMIGWLFPKWKPFTRPLFFVLRHVLNPMVRNMTNAHKCAHG